MDTPPTQFTVNLSKAIHLAYADQEITVSIKATDLNDAARFNEDATFDISFRNIVDVGCTISQIVFPTITPSDGVMEYIIGSDDKSYQFSGATSLCGQFESDVKRLDSSGAIHSDQEGFTWDN